MTRKISAYARKRRQCAADPSAIYRVMSRIQPFTAAELLELKTPYRVAFESLRTGRGGELDFHTIAAVTNVVLVMGERIGPECVEVAKLAQDALMHMLDRALRLGRWGVDALALQNIPPALDLHDQLLELCTPLQMQQAMQAVLERMRAGQTLAPEDFSNP